MLAVRNLLVRTLERPGDGGQSTGLSIPPVLKTCQVQQKHQEMVFSSSACVEALTPVQPRSTTVVHIETLIDYNLHHLRESYARCGRSLTRSNQKLTCKDFIGNKVKFCRHRQQSEVPS